MAGLGDLIRDIVDNTLFPVLGASSEGGITVSASYYRVTTGTYNPVTDTKTDSEALNTFDVVKYAARNREIDGIKVLVDDIRVLFPQSLIAFAPSADDRIEIGTNKYNIVNIVTDPVDATWILWLRGA